jgi:hypothetical protein
MNRGDKITLTVAGGAACAVCCAAPIAGALTAIGIGTLAATVWLGVGALAIGAGLTAFELIRRRRQLAVRSAG